MAANTGSNKLIILDRDGVINRTAEAEIARADDWVALPGSLDAIAFLTQADYTVVVACNLSGISRGTVSMQAVNDIHSKMHEQVQQAGGRIAGIWFCPHAADEHCDCRKPAQGMVLDILDRLNFEAGQTWLVGDSLRDLQAIAAAGGHPALVLSGKGKRTLAQGGLPDSTQVFDDLLAFALYRIEQDKQHKTSLSS